MTIHPFFNVLANEIGRGVAHAFKAKHGRDIHVELLLVPDGQGGRRPDFRFQMATPGLLPTAIEREFFAGAIAGYRTCIDIAMEVEEEFPSLVPARWAGVLTMVDQIVSEEGAGVTFYGSNPDFNNLPNECIKVTRGPFFVPEEHRADTLADCLRLAMQPPEAVQDEPRNLLDALRQWLLGRMECTMQEVGDALAIDIDQRSSIMLIERMLHQLNWSRFKVRREGAMVNVYRLGDVIEKGEQ